MLLKISLTINMIKFYTNGAGGSPSNGLLPGASVTLDPLKLGRYRHVCKMAFATQVFKITSGGSPHQRHAGRGCPK